ncbi:MAG: hypothetical protein EA408_02855 [Marinilabiliales bacterium]|nr:MAG: hypothetical protein EA408_02855 [Marinilabiliales bacterium]
MVLLPASYGAGDGEPPVQVSVTLPDLSPAAGDDLVLTFHLDWEAPFYSAFAEIFFDASVLEFISVTGGLLCEGGLAIGGLLAEGKAGISVTRTVPAEYPSSGPLMEVTFRVAPRAHAGVTSISISGLFIVNEDGLATIADVSSPVEPVIAATVSHILLEMDDVVQVEEGELFAAGVSLFASGLGAEDISACEIGVSPVCSDPSTWDEEMWTGAEFIGVDDEGNLGFSAEIAYMRPAQQWYVAVRASLCGEEFVYGGTGGAWDGDGSSCGELEIVPGPPYRYVIAGWDFDGESLMPSLAVPANREALFSAAGANITGFGSGYSGHAARSTGWHDGGDGSKYWFTEISTMGFTMLELSSRQSGSNTGPRFFSVEYSPDGIEWVAVEGGSIEVGSSWSTGVIHRLPLPAAAEDRENLFIRWAMTSDESISGNSTGSSGTNLIDDVYITGINADPSTVTVYPGDANNDGVVNADDVLPLGTFWLTAGPPAVWQNTQFVPRTVEAWIPAAATWADTNGDGVVDHRDLVMVGLHYGKSVSKRSKDTAVPLSVLRVNAGDHDGTVTVGVYGEGQMPVRGLAFSVAVEGMPDGMWDIADPFSALCGEYQSVGAFPQQGQDDILSFVHRDGNMLEAAFVLKGVGADRYGGLLGGFTIETGEWTGEFRVVLNRLTVSCSEHVLGVAREGTLSVTGPLYLPGLAPGWGEDGAGGGGLLPGYPNPFSGDLVIPFVIEEAGEVSVDILCVQGRVVKRVFSGFLAEGSYKRVFDGSLLAPGAYLCRLTVSGRPAGVIRVVRTGRAD